MTQVPEGAQRSEDGHYWWDAANNQWQAIEGGGAAGAPAAAGAAAGDERGQARVQAGLPSALHEVTPEQRQQYRDKSTVDAGEEAVGQTEVPEVTEHGDATA